MYLFILLDNLLCTCIIISMNTFDSLIIATGLKKQALQYRIKKIGIGKKYEGIRGKVIRVFTQEEADKIINYKGEKPGRKPKEES